MIQGDGEPKDSDDNPAEFTTSRMKHFIMLRPSLGVRARIRRRISEFYSHRINFPSFIKFVLVRFPIIEILCNYRPKWLIYDFLAGLAVGFVHVAQGLAYGNLAGVNSANGLYVSFFSPIVYAVFGESRHLSMGTIAVISLLIRSSTENCVEQFSQSTKNETIFNETLNSQIRTEASTTLSLLVGITLVIMSFLRCGVLVTYLTDSLVSGYLCAAGLFVFTSQIPSALGVKSQRGSGFGIFFQRWFYILKNARYANPTTVFVFLITIIPLSIGRYLNKKYIRYIKIALPLEIVAIIIAVSICANTSINANYNISAIGKMPSGLPIPKTPPSNYFKCIGSGFFTVAIVTMALNFSIVTRFADKFGYNVSTNQDLFAYGITNVVCCFFACFPACGSISRTAVAVSNLQQTQVAALVSSSFLVLLIHTITKYLEYLPLAILSAIVIVNIVPTILQITEFRKFWKVTMIEGLVWLSSFLSVLIFDVDNGLFLSIVISLLLNTIAIQRPSIKILGQLEPNDELFLEKDVFPVREIDGVKIVLMEAPLVSYNAKFLKKRVLEECGYPKGHNNPAIYSIQQKIIGSLRLRKDTDSVYMENTVFPKYLILDCSMMFAIDSNGLRTLLEINEITTAFDTKFYLCGLRETVLRTACSTEFFGRFDENNAFLTTKDAVDRIMKEKIMQQFMGGNRDVQIMNIL